MLHSRIVGRTLQRTERPLPGQAAFQLLLHFLCAPLFERVCAAAQGEQCDCEQKQKGLHLLIL
jgi:hypothetical protein